MSADCCIECWDDFRYDDVGGYNPPCVCGYHCRSCHEAIEGGRDWQDDCPEDDPSLAPDSATEARGEHAPSHHNTQTVVSLLPDQTARET